MPITKKAGRLILGLKQKQKMIANFDSLKIQEVIALATEVSIYIGLIFLYWFGFNKISRLLQRKIKNTTLISNLNITFGIVAVILSITTLIFAFIDNLSVFFGSLSILSAALVFTLQDFVSCFFAWIYIGTTKQYRVNDLIQITTSENIISGWIKEIDLFRTQIRERVGGEGMDRERPTGRIVTFPNNFIFKYSLSNQTKNHLILWHNFNIIITFESDYELARIVLEKALDDKFNELLQHPDQYFQTGIGELRNFKPKIYNTINDSGVEFGIWFGAKAGFYREILEQYSLVTLKTLKENKIDLAYRTTRMVRLEGN